MQWKLSQPKRAPIIWKRDNGAPGSAENVFASSTDDTVVKAEVKDGYVYFTNVAVGKAQVTVSGDTDPSDGVRNVSTTFDVEILSDDTADTVTVGEAEDAPPA
jgi:hypothetical protein